MSLESDNTSDLFKTSKRVSHSSAPKKSPHVTATNTTPSTQKQSSPSPAVVIDAPRLNKRKGLDPNIVVKEEEGITVSDINSNSNSNSNANGKKRKPLNSISSTTIDVDSSDFNNQKKNELETLKRIIDPLKSENEKLYSENEELKQSLAELTSQFDKSKNKNKDKGKSPSHHSPAVIPNGSFSDVLEINTTRLDDIEMTLNALNAHVIDIEGRLIDIHDIITSKKSTYQIGASNGGGGGANKSAATVKKSVVSATTLPPLNITSSSSSSSPTIVPLSAEQLHPNDTALLPSSTQNTTPSTSSNDSTSNVNIHDDATTTTSNNTVPTPPPSPSAHGNMDSSETSLSHAKTTKAPRKSARNV